MVVKCFGSRLRGQLTINKETPLPIRAAEAPLRMCHMQARQLLQRRGNVASASGPQHVQRGMGRRVPLNQQRASRRRHMAASNNCN